MIQLRVRTEYSMGLTYAPLGRVVERLKALGCTAAGMVDSTTWGHVAWVRACEAAGIRPLLGAHVIVSEIGVDTPTRMWFLARTTAGLGELYRAISKGHTTPVDGRPRLTREDVKAMSVDVLKFAGDLTDGAFLVDVRAYLDLNPTSVVLNTLKRTLADRHGLPLVSTSDNAFAFPEDAAIFECISHAGLRTTPQWILPASDLAYQHRAARIAEMCVCALPKAPMVRAKGNLAALCREGITARKMNWTPAYEQRLNYELDLIKSKDYESYFLIVADMVRYAKQHMLVGPSRGSAAGSLVCYVAGITEIDPIIAGLFFERFIDMARTDLPDIDLDFPDNKREMVFSYMTAKYGARNVARIGNIVAYAPRSALMHVSKSLHVPAWESDGVKTAMIERSSADARTNLCLHDTLTTTQAGKDFAEKYPTAAVIAAAIEGHVAHTSVHAAGLLVSSGDLQDYAVIDQKGIAQIEKGAAEYLGLLKIDVLGLRTLTILEDSGVAVDWYGLPFDDEKALDIFRRMKLCGIFQFDGGALRHITQRILVGSLADIDAITALARPGPIAGGVTEEYIARRGGKPYRPIHPLVAPYMADTQGLPVYQEQTLAIVRDIGKFSWKDTAQIRKAVSKSMGVEFFNTYWPIFAQGAASQGIDDTEARRTWDMICTMGAWQMNKAHTYSYAVISYWCAWLKAHHPLQFAVANLRNAIDEDHAVILLREMVAEGLRYVAFDPELSKEDWSIHEGVLYGGLLSLRGVGPKKAAAYSIKRAAGALTQKDREDLAKRTSPFMELFPITTRYKDWYANPRSHDIARDEISTIDSIMKAGVPHGEQRVFIGEVVAKNVHSLNDPAQINKRGGTIEVAPLEYLAIRFRDDTAEMAGKIDRWKYQELGVPIIEGVPVGAHLVVRATFYQRDGHTIPFAFIQAWRRIDNERKNCLS